jgi:hypothetical protein
VAFVSLVNEFIWKISLFGLSPGQASALGFIPAAMILCVDYRRSPP